MMYSPDNDDTIAALATSNGRGGIAVIKISGPRSLTISQSLFNCQSNLSLHPRVMIHGHIHDETGPIDEALVCFMPGPKSYTGEDVVEIQTHGGTAAAQAVLSLLHQRGIRPAEPGEFTRRAFLNGRIDLVQAESVMEIVSADTREQLRQAERLLDGAFSRRLQTILDLINLADSQVTLNIDFPDQIQGEIHHAAIHQTLNSCLETIQHILQTSDIGRRLHSGVVVVLCGAVNSGKSSLFNSLLGRKRSLVNSRPGTTRDWIEEQIDMGGLPVNLIDTAGLRETSDTIEREGVAESRRIIEQADIVLHLQAPLADVCPLSASDDDRSVTVYTKADLIAHENRVSPGLYTSTVTGEGIEDCKSAILAMVRTRLTISDTNPPILIERHRTHLEQSKIHIESSMNALSRGSEEIASLELRLAREEIQRITGALIDKDVLDSVFNLFCIGK